MSHNSITSLPKAGVSLSSLDLSYNNMKKIPDKMAISSIRYLTMSYNKLTTLENIPSGMSSFDVDHNYLVEINANAAKNVPQYPNLDYNYLPCTKYASKYKNDMNWYYVRQYCYQSKQYSCAEQSMSTCDELKRDVGICTPNNDRTKCLKYTTGIKDFCDFAKDAGIENCENILQNESCTDVSEYRGFVYDCDYGHVTEYSPKKMSDFLTEIPVSASKLSRLYTLDLSGLDLTSLPKSYANFKDTMYLDLSGNKLSSLPDELWDLEWLYSLNTSYNQLTSLPDSLGNLSRLKALDVSHNKLSALPDVFDSLPSLSLSNLYISHNSLTAVPKSFGRWFNSSSGSDSL